MSSMTLPTASQIANVAEAKRLSDLAMLRPIRGPQACQATVTHQAHVWTLGDEFYYRCPGVEQP